uniref:Sodium channel modifier 1 n=1 Tax=Pseudonaja textilis TaxID=8673 RepID=A0A670Z9Z2_PSETE
MSFKREGDDLSQLQVLKKRRVAELLANYIPEDEALLLRDGRYSCTVCFHRPVFDTLDMLTIHRSGKKHLAGLQRFYGKKVSLENEIQKRHHQAYLEAEENAPLLAQTRKITQNALLKTVPYNSCCRSKSWLHLHNQPPLLFTGMSPTSKAKSFSESSFLTEPREKKFARQGKGRKTRKSSEPDDPEKRRTLEHYLKLKSSGWIQDGSGKWVKDENVEFDTDEEEPPVLPPS